MIHQIEHHIKATLTPEELRRLIAAQVGTELDDSYKLHGVSQRGDGVEFTFVQRDRYVEH